MPGQDKLAAVKELLAQLEKDRTQKKLSDEDRRSKLEQLKVYGRDPRDATPIFTSETVTLLCQYAFGDQTIQTSREAMRCLANTLVLKQQLSQTFVDGKYGDKAAEHLKRLEDDDEFLICRILFLAYISNPSVFPELVEQRDLAKSIHSHLVRHAKQVASSSTGHFASPMASMALSENLKLIFFITVRCKDLVAAFDPCIAPLAELFSHLAIQQPPLQPPMSALINALGEMNIETVGEATDDSPLFPKSNSYHLVDKLVDILDRGTKSHPKAEIETLTVPLIALLCKIYGVASQSSKEHMTSLLLPPVADRDQPIGRSDSLSSRLLRYTTDPMTQKLKDAVLEMYFLLSDKDPTAFVQNIGYGFAAGYLMTNNIAVPPGATKDGGGDVPINPITGQRLDRENISDGEPEMTEEEKEREAERLFVLFERLKATGVVKVENPVTQAMRQGQGASGKVEEVEDSDSN